MSYDDLTYEERMVLDHLGDALYNYQGTAADDEADFKRAVRAAQNVVLAGAARRREEESSS